MADGEAKTTPMADDSALSDPLAMVTLTQARVSDPARSAWVSANAGSGKTYVLIQRVTRLLLAGTAPSKIVCITFTKAAAAEMADRLFGRLGEWALLDDAALRGELRAFIGQTAADGTDLRTARKLFARALETPGGLKIQTIHAFCEMILRRFPAEAGLLPGFQVMEDGEAKAAMEKIVDAVAEEALGNAAMLRSLDALADRFKPMSPSGGGFQKTLQELLGDFAAKRFAVAAAHAAAGGCDGFVEALHSRHGVVEGSSPDDILDAAAKRADLGLLREIAAAWAERRKTALETATKIEAMLADGGPSWKPLASLIFTADGEGTPRRGYPGDALSRKLIEDFDARWDALRDAFVAAREQARVLLFCHLNASLHRLGAEVTARYEARKRRTGLLDFEDLIERTVRLLKQTSNAWVLFKLDQGIDHILLDEAQDTATLQWDVIEALTEEFFAGQGAHEDRVDGDDGPRARTLFIVGDEKQSIYSFQGADARLFQEKRAGLERRIGQDFTSDNLALSFRTTPPVLRFVDEALAGTDRPLMDDYQRHTTRHGGIAGSVELWPARTKEDTEKGDAWDEPLDKIAEGDPRRQLAEDICARIKGWTEQGDEPLSNPQRRVRPGDILILCQTRGPQFHEVVGALSRHGIPAAGADKVKMKEDVAVRDAIALLRFAANTGDCLSLAELLKSPFWSVTEDELFVLANERSGRLWQAVRQRAEMDDPLGQKCRQARTEIETAIRAGRRSGAFGLLSAILERGQPSGRQRIARRLGHVPNEALDELLAEALEWEGRHPRTIEGFLAYLEGFDGEVKKDPTGRENKGPGAVRVMTVHGAKGLESPIVILADAAYLKDSGDAFRRSPLVELGMSDTDRYKPINGALVCAPGSPNPGPDSYLLAKEAADAARLAEYRRLFYVAATRAEERLYICGVANSRRKDDAPDHEADWHALSERALRRLSETREIETPLGKVLRYQTGQPVIRDEAQSPDEGAGADVIPEWLTQTAANERSDRAVQPSRGPTADEAIAHDDPFGDEGPAYPPHSPGQDHAPYRRGTALHRLLERLPAVPAKERRALGEALLLRDGADAGAAERAQWLEEALAVMDDARFAGVFAETALAEVPVVGRIGGQLVSGQIDRLLVKDDEIVIVDFKSNRPPPARPEQVAPAVLFQLAAYEALIRRVYPGREVRSALLWTYAPRLMPVPPELLAGQLSFDGQ